MYWLLEEEEKGEEGEREKTRRRKRVMISPSLPPSLPVVA